MAPASLIAIAGTAALVATGLIGVVVRVVTGRGAWVRALLPVALGLVLGSGAASMALVQRAADTSSFFERPVSAYTVQPQGDPSVSAYGVRTRAVVCDDAGHDVRSCSSHQIRRWTRGIATAWWGGRLRLHKTIPGRARCLWKDASRRSRLCG